MPKRNKGLQSKYRTDRGTWEVGEYIKGKWKRHVTGLDSFEQAENEKYVLERKRRGHHTHNIEERMIDQCLADYIEERGEQISSLKTLGYAIRDLVGFWGGKPLSYITEATCNAYYAYRGVSDASAGRELRTLRAAINRDYDMGRITRKPRVWLRKESYARPEIPTKEDVILQARKAGMGTLSRRYILTAYYTGARKSQVLRLRISQISDCVDFNPPGTKQNNKRKPIVPMNNKLKSFMRIWKQETTDYLFTRNGRPVKDLKRIMPNLRHAAAVQMLRNGVPPYKVAKYLGNSVEMIYHHYGHLMPDYLGEAANAL